MGLINSLGSALFGSSNDRRLKKYAPIVKAINEMEPEIEKLTDDELKAKTTDFRSQLADGKKLKDLLIPAFAVVREAAKRTLGQRHYDVQLIGGMVLNEGSIAEMKTGEGKTLVSTLPAYLNALEGKGVHIVTVNDYLAKRDSEWMGQVFEALGMTTACIEHDLPDEERKKRYACDITYGTNNEFGFDYLRDNMKYHMEDMVQRGHGFAVIDEVDSILIDEARTPLIISGPLEDKADLYVAVNKIIPGLVEEDYELEEKHKNIHFTEEGMEHVEQLLKNAGLLEGESLYDAANVSVVHHLNQALKAHKLFTRDKDYIVKNNEVIIIDEFTGRMMEGRRYSDGLHQAIEAKENAEIQSENQTLASITFQNYFRLYSKLSGMTGTALTEQEEFLDIYGLDTLAIPTNLPIARIDEHDEIYRSGREKYNAIIIEIEKSHEKGQPVLVGTTSIEKSELLASMLEEKGLPHQVLNARHHEREAFIVAAAGVPGAVTIATNMAGRGTDIQLGGNLKMRLEEETEAMEGGAKKDKKIAEIKADIASKKQQALDAGGLYVIGTERHESRRIDNQLRGRSGRQGDPGRSKFYLSLDDDLMRIFGSDRMDGMLKKLGIKEDEAIIHPWITKMLERAQKKVEMHHYDVRKNVLKYDDVMNGQRKTIFEQRIEFMKSDDVSETIKDMRHQLVDDLVSTYIPANSYSDQWETEKLGDEIQRFFNLSLPIKDWADEEGVADNEVYDRIIENVDSQAAQKAADFTPPVMREVEKSILLQTLDHLWREHLLTLEHLRQVIGLRGLGQRDPLNEYQTESFTLFEQMLAEMREEVTGTLSHIQLAAQEDLPSLDDMELPEMEATHEDYHDGDDYYEGGSQAPDETPVIETVRSRQADDTIDPTNPRTWGKVARNSPCPCGSGKKYKHCHGAIS